jgi:hypothetical protein
MRTQVRLPPAVWLTNVELWLQFSARGGSYRVVYHHQRIGIVIAIIPMPPWSVKGDWAANVVQAL